MINAKVYFCQTRSQDLLSKVTFTQSLKIFRTEFSSCKLYGCCLRATETCTSRPCLKQALFAYQGDILIILCNSMRMQLYTYSTNYMKFYTVFDYGLLFSNSFFPLMLHIEGDSLKISSLFWAPVRQTHLTPVPLNARAREVATWLSHTGTRTTHEVQGVWKPRHQRRIGRCWLHAWPVV